jgi:hypothetical protein
MKPTSLILMCLFFCHSICAQNIREKVSKNGVEYTVTTLDPSRGSSVVRNASNKIYKEKHKPPKGFSDSFVTEISFDKESADRARSLIIKAFADAGKPVPAESIHPIFFINPNGKILELEFMLRDSSEISVDDINLIEKTLISQFAFKTRPVQLKKMPVIKLYWPIRRLK